MIDKEEFDFIKGIVSTYCAVSTQAIGIFIQQYMDKAFAKTTAEAIRKKVQSPIDIYNELCVKLGILKIDTDKKE